MNFSNELPNIFHDSFIENLKTVFDTMETAYDTVAKKYGFNCTGCAENCCLTRFYHHTLLEHLYIEKGFKTLNSDKQKEVLDKAKIVVEQTQKAEIKGEPIRFMCPLNFEGSCILYEYRPMICRLHGIEHELVKPGHLPIRSSGCELFTEQTKNTDYIKFDRTPHYIEMAKLERELRTASGFMKKIKHTIAEMLLL